MPFLVYRPNLESQPVSAKNLSPNPPSAANVTVEDLNVVFQPIVELSTGATFAVEALVRCKLPDLESPPVLFELAAAERCCGQLGRNIRHVAFSLCQDTPLFVNVHPHELSEQWLVRPDDPLFFHNYAVYLEITESAAFTYFDLCIGSLKEVCSRAGAHLVIDDLGAGHSNLKRIVDLEPQIVKLDLTLTRGIDKNPRQRILVRQVVSLCSELGADVVAEGIETIEELKAIVDTGARYGQGFLLAKPQFPVPQINWPLP